MIHKEFLFPNNGHSRPEIGNSYFSTRILVTDENAYGRVISYLDAMKNIQIDIHMEKSEEMRDYIFDREKRQVARVKDHKRIIELTNEINTEIKEEIEKIVMRYSSWEECI